MSRAQLQVALDFTDLEEALRVARLAIVGGADILEAGTPLIKSVGMEAVRSLRKTFPGATIVADMKTMDASEVEVRMVGEAGGDVTTVLGVADDSTIIKAVETARALGVKVCVDMIGVQDPLARAREVAGFGVDMIGLHIGIDVQRARGLTAEALIGEISALKGLGLPICVAGGLNERSVGRVVDAGADVVIVGSAITRSSDPAAATRIIKRAMGGPV